MTRRATNSDGSKVERRRAQRFHVTVPLEVSWRGPDNEVIKEEAVARQVNANGGLLEMMRQPEMGTRVTIANFISAETAEARVLATPSTREGVAHGIAVELITPNESFWGVDLQVKRASIELQKLENSLRAGGIDLRLLKEYRDAAEYVRTAAGAVKQLRDCQLQGHSDTEVVAFLCAERIRRTAALCHEVLADIEAGRVHAETKGIEDYYHVIEQTMVRLGSLLRRPIADGPQHRRK
jgi:hypothetical protein